MSVVTQHAMTATRNKATNHRPPAGSTFWQSAACNLSSLTYLQDQFWRVATPMPTDTNGLYPVCLVEHKKTGNLATMIGGWVLTKRVTTIQVGHHSTKSGYEAQH
jgi:hypothetical protein